MREALSKFASISRHLRQAVLNKEAGVLGALGKAVINNPVSAPLAAMGVVGGAGEAKGKFKQYKAGFDPKVQQATGQAPVPPGTS